MSLSNAWNNIDKKGPAGTPEAKSSSSALSTSIQWLVCSLQTPGKMTFGWVSLRSKNHKGRPEGSAIAVSEYNILSNTHPECTEDSNTSKGSKYNAQWALLLAKELWEQLPTEEELLTFLNAIPGDAGTKIRLINKGIFPGYRNTGFGDAWNSENYACWWAIASDGSLCCVYLKNGETTAKRGNITESAGYSVRFLFKEAQAS